MRPLSSIVPKRGAERWLYETLRHLQQSAAQAQAGLNAIVRGEVPDGSGGPLPTPDLSGYFKLGGRNGGQTGFGGFAVGENLILGSTFNASKGFIHLGSPTPRLSVDETQKLVGINKAAPASTLHIVASDQGVGSLLTPNSAIADNWGGPRGGAGGGGIGGSTDAALASNDGITSYVAVNVNGGVGANPQKNGLNGTILPGATYQVSASIACFSSGVDITDNGTVWMVSLVDANGDQWDSAISFSQPYAAFAPGELSTTAQVFGTVTRTVVCSGTPVSSGNTPNAVWMHASMENAAHSHLYSIVSYITVAQTGSSIMRWDGSSGTQLGVIDLFGHVGLGLAAPAAQLDILPSAAGVVGLKIAGASSQSSDLVDISSPNTGNATFLVDKDAFLRASILGSSFLVDSSDKTKKQGFDVSDIDTATTRTLKIPNQAGVNEVGIFALTTNDSNTGDTVDVDISNAGGQGSRTINAAPTGRSIRITAAGVITNLVNATIQLKIKHGTTVVLDTGAFNLGSTCSDWKFIVVLTWRSATTVMATGFVEILDQSLGVEYLLPWSTGTTPVTVSSTGDISLTAAWGGNNTPSSDNVITTLNFNIETIY